MVEASLAYLENCRQDCNVGYEPLYDELIRSYRRRRNALDGNSEADPGFRPEDYERWRDISRHIGAIQRATVLHMRNENEINDQVARMLERELDLAEARYSA
jgi:CPA1 family monovalent cation:H+ antiporter